MALKSVDGFWRFFGHFFCFSCPFPTCTSEEESIGSPNMVRRLIEATVEFKRFPSFFFYLGQVGTASEECLREREVYSFRPLSSSPTFIRVSSLTHSLREGLRLFFLVRRFHPPSTDGVDEAPHLHKKKPKKLAASGGCHVTSYRTRTTRCGAAPPTCHPWPLPLCSGPAANSFFTGPEVVHPLKFECWMLLLLSVGRECVLWLSCHGAWTVGTSFFFFFFVCGPVEDGAATSWLLSPPIFSNF